MPAAGIRLANEAWEALLTAHAAVLRGFACEPVWKEHGLSMREYDVLYTLAKCGVPARVGELQANVLLSQPALSRLVDRLTERRLVERTADPDDGRAVRVRLTAEGRELQLAVGRSHARSVAREVGGALTEGELHELRRIAAKLAAARGAADPGPASARDDAHRKTDQKEQAK